MKEEKTTPLRERMIEDMRIRGMSPKTQQGHIRAVRYFAEFIGRSPDTATPDELRAYQLHMTDTGVSTGVFNARIVSLRFFFGMTCGREEMKRYMQFRRKAKKLPVVLSVEDVGDLLAAVPGPGLCIEVDFSLPAERVVRSLNQIIEWRGQPHAIRVDNGPEYISGTLMTWAEKRNIRLEYIQPGKPQQNGYIERYNRTVRGEWLGQYIFETIEEAQDKATEWLWTYNNERPNMGIGGITPAMKLKTAA
ncbi:hypothetical protein E2K80_02070 [Rhodophyticola sp. CCM32]|uniref:integrase core domain-containing protein n=1 Tax=Rhodophyticola sp. CCM32 TaxID=2916397 RepID=UPI00107F5822|nr:integrase core domain-containing protein [Rhodophyticola sp. CCM32]QBX99659.1 hypothetical protein E2K80_02070 [Rhodophyticola sp. CCM32]